MKKAIRIRNWTSIFSPLDAIYASHPRDSMTTIDSKWTVNVDGIYYVTNKTSLFGRSNLLSSKRFIYWTNESGKTLEMSQVLGDIFLVDEGFFQHDKTPIDRGNGIMTFIPLKVQELKDEVEVLDGVSISASNIIYKDNYIFFNREKYDELTQPSSLLNSLSIPLDYCKIYTSSKSYIKLGHIYLEIIGMALEDNEKLLIPEVDHGMISFRDIDPVAKNLKMAMESRKQKLISIYAHIDKFEDISILINDINKYKDKLISLTDFDEKFLKLFEKSISNLEELFTNLPDCTSSQEIDTLVNSYLSNSDNVLYPDFSFGSEFLSTNFPKLVVKLRPTNRRTFEVLEKLLPGSILDRYTNFTPCTRMSKDLIQVISDKIRSECKPLTESDLNLLRDDGGISNFLYSLKDLKVIDKNGIIHYLVANYGANCDKDVELISSEDINVRYSNSFVLVPTKLDLLKEINIVLKNRRINFRLASSFMSPGCEEDKSILYDLIPNIETIYNNIQEFDKIKEYIVEDYEKSRLDSFIRSIKLIYEYCKGGNQVNIEDLVPIVDDFPYRMSHCHHDPSYLNFLTKFRLDLRNSQDKDLFWRLSYYPEIDFFDNKDVVEIKRNDSISKSEYDAYYSRIILPLNLKNIIIQDKEMFNELCATFMTNPVIRKSLAVITTVC